MPPDLRAALQSDALPTLFGAIVLAIGVLCIVFGLTRRPRSAAFLGLGFSGLLYGARLIVGSRSAVEVFGVPRAVSQWTTMVISYVILLPFLLFFRSLVEEPWKRRLDLLLWVNAALAIVCIAADALLGRVGASGRLNSGLVLVDVVVIGTAVIRAPGLSGWEAERLRRAFSIAGIFVVLENVRGLGLGLGFWPASAEPIGLAIFLGILMSIAFQRIGETEARLAVLRHDLDTARDIQRGLLPSTLPSIAGVSMAVRYQPAEEVGGDFYDVVQTADRALGVLIADVSGHGIPAALIASMVKVAAAAQPAQEGRPERVLAAIQRALNGQLRRQFVTAACVVVDAEAMSCTWANAGHPPPRLVRAGTVVELAPTGGAIGRLDRSQHAAGRRALQPGDRLVLFSDAVTEALSPTGEPFGDDRLDALLCRESPGLEALADSLLAELGSWTGRGAGEAVRFDDDLTLVVVQVR